VFAVSDFERVEAVTTKDQSSIDHEGTKDTKTHEEDDQWTYDDQRSRLQRSSEVRLKPDTTETWKRR